MIEPVVIYFDPSLPIKRPKNPAVTALISGKITINKYIGYNNNIKYKHDEYKKLNRYNLWVVKALY